MTTLVKTNKKALLYIALVKSFLRGFSVLYLLFLPILYATHLIGALELGYIGACLVAGTMVSALLLSFRPYKFKKVRLLHMSMLVLLCASILLFWPQYKILFSISYLLVGLSVGVGITIIDELAADFTTQGKRFGIFANMSMLSDTLRIIYPLIVGFIYLSFHYRGLIIFSIINVGFLIFLLYRFIAQSNLNQITEYNTDNTKNPISLLKNNRSFSFVIGLEFFDSFISSQLFVFLPILLLFKGFTLENTLVLQSIVFLGYLSGRKIVGLLAQYLNGYKATAIAEIGMTIVIVLLLVLPSSVVIYILCFLLGLFARGTSPVIKALAFDQLSLAEFRRGSAVHLISGESGGVLGQLVFGFLLAWVGVNFPFILVAIIATAVAMVCFLYKPKSEISM